MSSLRKLREERRVSGANRVEQMTSKETKGTQEVQEQNVWFKLLYVWLYSAFHMCGKAL